MLSGSGLMTIVRYSISMVNRSWLMNLGEITVGIGLAPRTLKYVN